MQKNIEKSRAIVKYKIRKLKIERSHMKDAKLCAPIPKKTDCTNFMSCRLADFCDIVTSYS